jgi:hypothetical protein
MHLNFSTEKNVKNLHLTLKYSILRIVQKYRKTVSIFSKVKNFNVILEMSRIETTKPTDKLNPYFNNIEEIMTIQ